MGSTLWSMTAQPPASLRNQPAFGSPASDGRGSTSIDHSLGGVDGFDEDEAESKDHDGAVVLGRLLAAQRHPLEALELAPKLLDAGAGAIERSGEEPWPVPG